MSSPWPWRDCSSANLWTNAVTVFTSELALDFLAHRYTSDQNVSRLLRPVLAGHSANLWTLTNAGFISELAPDYFLAHRYTKKKMRTRPRLSWPWPV